MDSSQAGPMVLSRVYAFHVLALGLDFLTVAVQSDVMGTTGRVFCRRQGIGEE